MLWVYYEAMPVEPLLPLSIFEGDKFGADPFLDDDFDDDLPREWGADLVPELLNLERLYLEGHPELSLISVVPSDPVPTPWNWMDFILRGLRVSGAMLRGFWRAGVHVCRSEVTFVYLTLVGLMIVRPPWYFQTPFFLYLIYRF